MLAPWGARVTESNRKVLEKLRRLERLAESAASPGEREAAAAARRRLVESLERDGVHVAPEVVLAVGKRPRDPEPPILDGPTVELAEDLLDDDLVRLANQGRDDADPVARTVVVHVADVTEGLEPPPVDPRVVTQPLGVPRVAPARPTTWPSGPPSGPDTGDLPFLERRSTRAAPRGSGVQPGNTPMGARPDDVIIRSPRTSADDDRWVEAEETAGDAFVESTPVHATPPFGYPSAPPPGPPRPGRAPAPRSASRAEPAPPRVEATSEAGSTPVGAPAPLVWTKRRVALAALVVIVLFELLMVLFGPEPDVTKIPAQPGGTEPRAPTVVEKAAFECGRGSQRACAELGSSIARRARRGSRWLTDAEREACRANSLPACVALGRRFADEASARDAAARGAGDVSPGADPFVEIACSIGSVLCPY